MKGNFDGFAADGDELTDRLPVLWTDDSVDVWMKGIFPGFSACGNFHTGMFICIFTVGLADGRMDVTEDKHTVDQTGVLITSRAGWQTYKSCNWHTDGLLV